MHPDATASPSSQGLALFCGCALLVLAAEARAATPASERGALIALYNSTNGSGWFFRTGWRNAADTDFAVPGTECSWYGVQCDASGSHVTSLQFRTNGLSGSIPPEIGDFTNLSELVLSDYDWRFGGSIPPEIGRLTNPLGCRSPVA